VSTLLLLLLLLSLVPPGTLSGNPLAMTAGIKTLEILDRPGSYEHLDKVTSR
jgi:glutamate-1-semialdehyde aminotransferase